ncbi:hypothetical protein UB47_19165 [Pseudomonas sp. 5]|nr:hypothetical protein UB47_19165 [Pseudomonas sp. 5]
MRCCADETLNGSYTLASLWMVWQVLCARKISSVTSAASTSPGLVVCNGHAIGDQVLMFTAKRLKQMLRTADTVARIGGDEFVLTLEGFSPGLELEEEIQLICSNVIESQAFAMIISGELLQIGTSLGVAIYPDHAASMDTLIHLADLAMYEAKRSGDNQFRLAATACA